MPTEAKNPNGKLKEQIGKLRLTPVMVYRNCAFGAAKDKNTKKDVGVLVLAKKSAHSQLIDRVKKHFKLIDATEVRVGAGVIEAAADNKNMLLITPMGGRAGTSVRMALEASLKATGIARNRVQFTDEDFAAKAKQAEAAMAAETADADDDEAEAGEAEPATQPGGQPAPAMDKAALVARLKALIGRAQGLEAGDPRRLGTVAAAPRINALLNTGSLAGAAQAMDALAKLLDRPAERKAGAAQGTATAGGAASNYATLGRAWLTARSQVADEIGKLRDSVLASYRGESFAEEIALRFTERTAPVLDQLDSELARLLALAGKAREPEEQRKLVTAARATITRYQAFAADPLVSDLDDNPFTPVKIRQTVTDALSMLSPQIV